MSRLLLAAYLIEAGLLLIVAPWSAFWDRNYFNEAWPWLRLVATNNFFRGAVSGVGAVCVVASLVELFGVIASWRRLESWSGGPEQARP